MKVPENVDGINDYDENGYTPLHSAIVSGKVYTSIMSDALNDNSTSTTFHMHYIWNANNVTKLISNIFCSYLRLSSIRDLKINHN